jgi:hypothetical protein
MVTCPSPSLDPDSCDNALQPQLLVLTPQPGQFLALSRRRPVALLLPAALLPVGLRHPVADRLRGRFKFPGKLGRISARADQLDHLTAKLG